MNRLVKAIKSAEAEQVLSLIAREPRWLSWQEESGKNGLHYVCGIDVSRSPAKAAPAFDILKLLLDKGMDINSVHQIPDGNCPFPATPLWYAYVRGRNELQYSYLLEQGAKPDNCMFAIAWNDDVRAAKLFKQYGAKIESAHYLAAVFWSRYKVAEWFLDNGADVNYLGEEGYTALLLAVKRKQKAEYIEYLLKRGADPDAENREGLSPRKLAQQNRQKKILGLFE